MSKFEINARQLDGRLTHINKIDSEEIKINDKKQFLYTKDIKLISVENMIEAIYEKMEKEG